MKTAAADRHWQPHLHRGVFKLFIIRCVWPPYEHLLIKTDKAQSGFKSLQKGIRESQVVGSKQLKLQVSHKCYCYWSPEIAQWHNAQSILSSLPVTNTWVVLTGALSPFSSFSPPASSIAPLLKWWNYDSNWVFRLKKPNEVFCPRIANVFTRLWMSLPDCRQHYSSGISITSSSMISPCGMLMCSGGLFLQLSPEKGLHQDRDNGPPNAICMASRHGTFPHFPVSPFRRSIPCRRHNSVGLRWKELRQKRLKVHFLHATSITTMTQSWWLKLQRYHGFDLWAYFSFYKMSGQIKPSDLYWWTDSDSSSLS